MAMDQSALLELLEALKAAGVDERVRMAAQSMYQALIDAEAERLMTLREIAATAGLEESSVCRLFRRYQDTSPYQYLLRRKMNLAAAFLVEGKGRVKEAAQRVGFADPYHFSRCFKAVHGVAPSELLKHSRKA